MSGPAPAESTALRIGDVAKAAGTTTRTIRYYEEIGLLPGSSTRRSGAHRTYTEADVERLREIVRLKDLLGVTLEELKEIVEAEDARAALREEWHRGVDAERRRAILVEAGGHLDRQLELVHRRQAELARLEEELMARRRRHRRLLRELDREGG